jgi:hypothetical protein
MSEEYWLIKLDKRDARNSKIIDCHINTSLDEAIDGFREFGYDEEDCVILKTEGRFTGNYVD